MRAGKFVDVGEEAETHGVMGDRRLAWEPLVASFDMGVAKILRLLIDTIVVLLLKTTRKQHFVWHLSLH